MVGRGLTPAVALRTHSSIILTCAATRCGSANSDGVSAVKVRSEWYRCSQIASG